MKFSIILPVFNGADFVERAVLSIIEQKNNNVDVELIVIDGGSKDGTVDILTRYSDHIDFMVSEPDQGQCHAINKGFAQASGDVFGWLCHDDELESGALTHVAAIYQAHPETEVVIGACRRIFSDKSQAVTIVSPDVFERIGFFNGIDQPSCFWRSSLHEKCGAIDSSYRHAMDWDFWNRFARAGAHLQTTPQILSSYYFPPDSKTSANPEANLDEAYRIIKQHGPFDGQLADAYKHIFTHFDLAGCFDKPCKAKRGKKQEFKIVMNSLKLVFGEAYINAYNWTWISNQMRQRKWWR